MTIFDFPELIPKKKKTMAIIRNVRGKVLNKKNRLMIKAVGEGGLCG